MDFLFLQIAANNFNIYLLFAFLVDFERKMAPQELLLLSSFQCVLHKVMLIKKLGNVLTFTQQI